MKKIIYALIVIFYFSDLFGQDGNIKTDENGLTPNQVFKEISGQLINGGKAGNAWTSIGPFGGDVFDMAVSTVDPQIVFAAAGVPYKSTDGGQNWLVMDNLMNLSPTGIGTIEAASNGSVYASGPYTYYKIFKSDDNGLTWVQKAIPVNGAGLDIAIDPVDPNIIYAGLTSVIGSSTNNVIIKSVDGGDNWSWFNMINILPVGYSVVNLAIDPSDSQIIFAIGNEGFSNSIVAATFDGGATWENRTGNLPVGKPLNYLAISDQNVFIAGGQLFGGQVVGVYKTVNYGQSWQNISTGFPNKVSNAILIDPVNSDKMYVASEGDGIYFTTDGGSNWTYSTSGAGNTGAARCLVFEPGNTNVIYAGFLSLGVCKSPDASQSWELANHGIATLLTNDIEVDPNDPLKILVGFEAENSGGCYLSNDGGDSWQLVEGLPGTRFSKVCIGIDGALFAWSNGPSSVAQEGLYKSVDGGTNWDNMGPNIGGLFETEIFALDVSESDPNLIFIGGNNFGVNGWESVVHRSVDGGEIWENVYVGPEFDSFKYLFVDPNSGNQVVYGAFATQNDHAGFIKSNDSGSNWIDINTGIPGTNKWSGSIVCDPLNSDILYGGIGGYGDLNGTVYKSVDGGSSWLPTPLSLDFYSKISDILISPLNSEVVYAASTQNGVYISTDAGLSWESSNDSLVAGNITAFSDPFMEPDNSWHFCASSFSNSAFKTTVFDPVTEVPHISPNENDPWIISNPSIGSAKITLRLVSGSKVKIILYNSLGQHLKTLVNSALGGGDFSWEFSQHPGIYYLMVSLDSMVRTETIIIY
jgi:photosystem II stability/assembly factor-like uncharacterized protein